MKRIRLSALSAAMIMSAAAHSNALTDNELIKDSSLDIHLRNYYKNDGSKADDTRNPTQVQWSQSISANFTSGFYDGLAGFDLGGYYALKLRGQNNAMTGLLPVKDDGDSFSYGKTTYAIKFNLNGMGVAKYGRMFLETPLLNDSDSRSLPSLTEAFYVEGTLDALYLYAILATKNNPRSESGFDSMMVNGSKKDVKVAGGNYDFRNGLNTHVAIGQQDDFARRAYVHLDYARDIVDMDGYSVNAGLVYANNDRIGFSKEADEDNSQKTWGVILGASLGKASFGIRYQAVNQTDMGAFDTTWSVGEDGDSDNTEYFGPNAMMISDFNASGQKSWGFNAGYDFTGMVDGLNLSAAYVMGDQDPKGENNDTDEKEYNLMASYSLPQMEGLNLAAQYGKNTQKPEGSSEIEATEVRFIVKYDMSAF